MVGQLNENFWTSLPSVPDNDGIVFLSVVIDTQDQLYLGTNMGLFKSSPNGGLWQQFNLNQVPIFKIALFGQKIYAVSNEGTIHYSLNSGTDWLSSQLPVEEITDILILNNGDLLVSTGYIEVKNEAGYFRGNGVFKSTDEGKTWHKVNIGLSNDHYIGHLAKDSKERLYASANEYGTKDGALLYSTDKGDSWQTLPDVSFDWGNVNETSKIVLVTSLEIDPQDSIRVSLLGAKGSAATSVNLTNSFEGASNGNAWKHMHLVTFGYPWDYLGAHTLFFASKRHIFASRSGQSFNLSGIFHSNNQGVSFNKQSIDPIVVDGVPNFNYCYFVRSSAGRVFVVQELDNRIYYTDIDEDPVLGGNKDNEVKWRAYPNPFDKEIHLEFDRVFGHMDVTILSLSGSVLLTKTVENQNELIISPDDLPNGVYILQTHDGKNIQQLKLLKQ